MNRAVRQQLAQFGVLVSTMGTILCLIGLYPGVTGLEPKTGIGILQIIIILIGMTLIVTGGLIFVKVAFYSSIGSNLAQRIAVRLSLTGLLFAAAGGLSDVLGFGSNPTGGPEDFPILGPYQSWGIVIGFVTAALGVAMFLMMGPPPDEAALAADKFSTQEMTIPR